MSFEAQIQLFIARNLLFSGDGFGYSDDASFLREGIVDSIGILELVTFIENSFNIRVDDTELTPDNFDSINKVAAYIHNKISR